MLWVSCADDGGHDMGVRVLEVFLVVEGGVP